jgi:hypothetical protein
VQLSLEHGRVIGCLIEKQLTTPQQYPLTLNALVLACNQASNRDPVVCYDDHLVQRALAWLKEAGLVRFVYPSHGRSVTRYRQVLDEFLALDVEALALLAVLLLRGPQTAGELRIRTERMARFDDLASVDTELDHLGARTEPLVMRLARRPGQKEERWVEVLTADARASDDIVDRADRETPADRPLAVERQERTPAQLDGRGEHPGQLIGGSQLGSPDFGALVEEGTALRAEVAALRAEVAALRAAVDELRATSSP